MLANSTWIASLVQKCALWDGIFVIFRYKIAFASALFVGMKLNLDEHCVNLGSWFKGLNYRSSETSYRLPLYLCRIAKVRMLRLPLYGCMLYSPPKKYLPYCASNLRLEELSKREAWDTVNVVIRLQTTLPFVEALVVILSSWYLVRAFAVHWYASKLLSKLMLLHITKNIAMFTTYKIIENVFGFAIIFVNTRIICNDFF